MNKSFLSSLFSVIFFIIMCSLSFAQEEAIDYAYGKVKNASSQEIVIGEYEYKSEEVLDVTYAVDPNIQLKNINTLDDSIVGFNVDIDFIVKDGKKIAKVIELEKKIVKQEKASTETTQTQEQASTETTQMQGQVPTEAQQSAPAQTQEQVSTQAYEEQVSSLLNETEQVAE